MKGHFVGQKWSNISSFIWSHRTKSRPTCLVITDFSPGLAVDHKVLSGSVHAPPSLQRLHRRLQDERSPHTCSVWSTEQPAPKNGFHPFLPCLLDARAAPTSMGEI